jgi:hypothetical protein
MSHMQSQLTFPCISLNILYIKTVSTEVVSFNELDILCSVLSFCVKNATEELDKISLGFM